MCPSSGNTVEQQGITSMAKSATNKRAPKPDFESIEDCKRHITALGKKISAERIKHGPSTPLFKHLVEKQDAAKERLTELLAPPKPAKPQPKQPAKHAPKAGMPSVQGKARSVIVDACSRREGASSKELFAATGWKFASWSHQLRLAAEKTGRSGEIRKVDGTTRYFLTEPATTGRAA
jgi:hypothetical protein